MSEFKVGCKYAILGEKGQVFIAKRSQTFVWYSAKYDNAEKSDILSKRKICQPNHEMFYINDNEAVFSSDEIKPKP